MSEPAVRPLWLVQDALLDVAEREPERVCVIADGRTHSYGELLDDARRLARALQELGLRRGDRVAVRLENSWAAVVAIYGTLLAGGVFVVLNPQTKGEKLGYVLADCEARVLIADGDAEALAAAARVPGLAVIAEGRAGGGDLRLEALLASAPPAPREPGTIPLDLAALVYTSGSTGVPKGVMLTHANLVFVVDSIARYLRLGPDERIFDVFPLAFVYGLNQLLLTVRLGAALVLERSFAFPARVLEGIAGAGVTVFPGVPTIFATLLALRTRPSLDTVTRVTNAGAALPPEYLGGMREIFPRAHLFLMYGCTECKRVSYLEPELVHERPRSVGKAIPGTEAFVLTEEGRLAAPGEVGVLHVRGPHVMAGYWRQPELTAQVLREGRHPGERILRTGDLFRTDEDGFLHFVSRTDDIIKTRGEKVAPIEVEHALYEIAGVREAAVVGVPDDVLGQAVRAYVVLDDGAVVTELDVKRACRERLENHMVPRDVIFLDELPKTETGKIRRKSLAELVS